MRLFLDTGAIVALHNKDDEHHAETKKLFDRIAAGELSVTKLYSSDYILDESITTCYARTANRKLATELGRALLESKSIIMLKVDQAMLEEAWRVFSQRFLDVPLSFTDCTTYALVQAHSIPHIFSFDSDFDKLGLNRVPK